MSHTSVSRRRFIQTAGAASVWVPTTVKGYTGAEMRSMSAPHALQVGVSKWDLDTPALCVDFDAEGERNLVGN